MGITNKAEYIPSRSSENSSTRSLLRVASATREGVGSTPGKLSE
jgi:hypothetical protein